MLALTFYNALNYIEKMATSRSEILSLISIKLEPNWDYYAEKF